MGKTRTETMNCKTTIVRSSDNGAVYEFTNEYGFEGEKALVITLSSESDNTTTTYDRTKYYTFTNMTHMGYSTVTIYNLFTRVNEKLIPSSYSNEEILESLKYLKKLLSKNYDAVVVAFGTKMAKNSRVKECKKLLYELLISQHQEEKTMRIVDNMELFKQDEEQCIHPLYAGSYMGGKWKLIPFDVKTVLAKMEEQIKETKTEDNEEPSKETK